MKTITYNLREKGNSGNFYKTLAVFTDRFLTKVKKDHDGIINEYSGYIRFYNIEKPRSWGEYAFEYLLIGIFWKQYSRRAEHLNTFQYAIIKSLIKARRISKDMKLRADLVRGYLGYFYLGKDTEDGSFSVPSNKNLSNLLKWMAAAQEFEQEAERLETWREFFSAKERYDLREAVYGAVELAAWFEDESAKYLGQFTNNVEPFLLEKGKQYRFREDRILCLRKPVEYHGNMVGSELMNRAFAEDFAASGRKAVLLPQCMCILPKNKCKAEKHGLDITCIACTDGCFVKRYTEMGKQQGFDVYVIPHSSDFSHWLERWSGNPGMGLVGVACILHLIKGGYEMKALDIPAQCVFLDYCGCKGHWHDKGIPTDLNGNKLEEIMSCKIQNEFLPKEEIVPVME